MASSEARAHTILSIKICTQELVWQTQLTVEVLISKTELFGLQRECLQRISYQTVGTNSNLITKIVTGKDARLKRLPSAQPVFELISTQQFCRVS